MIRVAARPLLAALVVLASASSSPARAAAIPEQQGAIQLLGAASLTGTLHIIWGDPHPDAASAGTIQYLLALPNGRMLALEMGGLGNEALALFNKPVVVTGRMASRPVGLGGQAGQQEELLVVESIALNPAAPEARQSPAAVTGTRKVIYLLVAFAGDAVPHPPSWYLNFNNPDAPPAGELFPTTINGFYKKTSWDQFSWVGDVGGVGGVGAPGGWLTLPGSKSAYANCGWSSVCVNLSALSNDAITLGKAAGINFTVYDNINFVLSNDLDCCAWGGGWSFDGKSYGATWEPPWGQEADTYSHEFGHSLGLPHSGWVYYAYDSPWDTMSAHTRETTQACGSYNSANSGGSQTLYCSTPGGGFISAHKQFLGWIPGANLITTDTTATVNTLIEGLSLPLGGATKMIKICLPGFSCDSAVSTARYFTVETRIKALGTPSQYDNAIPGDGVIIHDVRRNRPAIGGACFFNSQSGWALPIDADPGDYNATTCSTSGIPAPAALFDAQFTPGQTYINGAYGFRVAVGNRTGNAFDVTVGPAVVPGAPTNVSGIPGNKQVMVSFSPPSSNGGFAITGYTVTASPGGNTATGASSPLVVTGLLNGTPYTFTVKATNSIGTGAPSAPSTPVTPTAAPLIDLNGDGGGDALLYDAATGYWSRQISQAVGGFVQQSQGGWSPGWSVFRADFNADALSDVFLHDASSGQWFKLLNDGAGYSTESSGYWWPGWQKLVLELNGDGLSDLFLYDPATGQWYKAVSIPGGFTYTTGYWTTGWEITPVRLNGDAFDDLFLIDRTTGQWYWVFGEAGGAFTYPKVGYWSPDWALYPGDFNGDGLGDLFLYRPNQGQYYVALNNGAGYNYTAGYGWAAGWTPFVGDFDGDGSDDLFLYSATTGVWFEMISDGLGGFTVGGNQTWTTGWQISRTDFDGDGRTDFLLYDPASGFWYQARNLVIGSFEYSSGFWAPGLTIITRAPIR